MLLFLLLPWFKIFLGWFCYKFMSNYLEMKFFNYLKQN